MFLLNTLLVVFLFNKGEQSLVKYLSISLTNIGLIFSQIHALYTIILSCFFLSNVLTEEFYSHSLALSMGYALYDSILLLKLKKRIWKQMLLHHGVIVFVLLPILYSYDISYRLSTNYVYYVSLNYLTEISTIPLNVCWYYSGIKNEDSEIFKIAAYLTIITYFIYRICLGFYMVYSLYFIETIPHPSPEIQLGMLVLNSFWFYKLCRKAKTIKINKTD